MTQRLENKTALVTAAGAGIGRAVALAFAREGATVIATDVNAKLLETLAADAKGLSLRTQILDVLDPAAIQAAAKQHPNVDVLFNGAGFVHHGSVLDCTEDEWSFAFDLNVRAMYRTIKAFVPGMKEAGFGRIVHLNGPDGFHGMASRIPAAVGKGGIRVLTKSLAEALGPYGITVNDINPGFAQTERDFTTHPLLADDDLVKGIVKEIPIGRQTRLEEIAFACAFLCSPRSAPITGNTIHLDGGHKMLS